MRVYRFALLFPLTNIKKPSLMRTWMDFLKKGIPCGVALTALQCGECLKFILCMWGISLFKLIWCLNMKNLMLVTFLFEKSEIRKKMHCFPIHYHIVISSSMWRRRSTEQSLNYITKYKIKVVGEDNNKKPMSPVWLSTNHCPSHMLTDQNMCTRKDSGYSHGAHIFL